MKKKKYSSLREFYPFYLTEHNNTICRTLHFIGTFLVFCILILSFISQIWWGLAFIPIVGYGFAWVGHFVFEKNKPATFQYPAYSLASDFILFFDMIKGKQPFNPTKIESKKE
ncbi:MAG: DUF962 domain-containing protein [Cyclobacteriaceae bacterium]|nr:DUF962 domain-containing protein [Cyclobacteriaceae bacterium]